MPSFVARNPHWREPDPDIVNTELARAERPFRKSGGDLNRLRDRLLELMWEDVGIIRDRSGMQRALTALDGLEAKLLDTGLADGDRDFNLTWHDWLNLRSQIEVSRVVTLAALNRENSRGAHFRSDFPEAGDLETSRYTVVRERGGSREVSDEPVAFPIVRPGESLLKDTEAAE